MKLELFAIGEVMAEIRREPELGFRVGFAGDTFNTAVYCARQLGASGRVGYCTRVGLDPLSEASLPWLRKRTSMCRTSPATRNTSLASTPCRRMLLASAASTTGAAVRRLGGFFLPTTRWVSFRRRGLSLYRVSRLRSCIPPARRRLIDHLRTLRERNGCLVAFDSNYRPRLWKDAETARRIIGEMWEIADIALPSIDDEMALFGDASEESVIARFGAGSWSACAIKRGVRGPISPHLAHDAHPAFARLPGLSIRRLPETVSTVATLRHLLAVKMNGNAC